MNQLLSRARLSILVVLLLVEIALVVSLRASGWNATGNVLRSFLIVVAAALPFVMTVILLYRIRAQLRRGQFSIRALIGLTLVVASFLALLPLLAGPEKPNTGPSAMSTSVTFEVFTALASPTPGGISHVDPATGTATPVANTPILTAADIATVELAKRWQRPDQTVLLFQTTPAGGNKILTATRAAVGSKLVVVVNGEVLAAPIIHQPIAGNFYLNGGRIYSEGQAVFDELTAERLGEEP